MANNQSGVNAHTIVANGRITVPSGRNLLNESTRTLMPSQGALAYGEDTILLYYGDDTDWLLLAAGGIGPTGPTGPNNGVTGATGIALRVLRAPLELELLALQVLVLALHMPNILIRQ